MNYKELFVNEWARVQQTAKFQALANTVENSPWHREENVLVHTQMVVSEYLKLWTDAFDKEMYLGAWAAAFHDMGKPIAEEVVHSEERGEYRRYAGHEHSSAIEWLDFILGDATQRERLELNEEDVYLVAWMVEYHLPYGVRDKVKRQALYNTMYNHDCVVAFCTLLLADCLGRISDDHPTKLQSVREWIAEFQTMLPLNDANSAHTKTAYVLMGTSSSGKSTYRKQLLNAAAESDQSVAVFSMDEIRMELFAPDVGTEVERYQQAFLASCGEGEPEFKAAVEKRLNWVFSSDNDVVISDNCNLAKKARSAFIARARQKGYRVVGVWLMTHPKVALARQDSREDRSGVPIWKQFNQTTVPSFYSEVSELCLILAD